MEGDDTLPKYIVSYIEDNELGVYSKRILEQCEDFFACVDLCKEKYPTVFNIGQAKKMSKEEADYFTHEMQDAIQEQYRSWDIKFGTEVADDLKSDITSNLMTGLMTK